MKKKELIIILVLSVVVWYLSKITQAIINFKLFSPLVSTGYPLAFEVGDDDPIHFIYYLGNIVFWFIVIYIFWKFILKKILKSSKK